MRSSKQVSPAAPRAKKGETLVETLVSVLLFVILMTGVASLLMGANTQLLQAREAAEKAQATYNEAVAGTYTDFTVTSAAKLVFRAASPSFSDEQPVTAYAKDGFIAFEVD